MESSYRDISIWVQEPKMVYVLGTTHRSEQSAEDVQALVEVRLT